MPSNESIRISNRRLHRSGRAVVNPMTRVSSHIVWSILSAIATVLAAPADSYADLMNVAPPAVCSLDAMASGPGMGVCGVWSQAITEPFGEGSASATALGVYNGNAISPIIVTPTPAIVVEPHSGLVSASGMSEGDDTSAPIGGVSEGSSQLTYYLTLIPLNPTAPYALNPVPLLLSLNLATSATTSGPGEFSLASASANFFGVTLDACTNTGPACTPTIDFTNAMYQVAPYQQYDITLTAAGVGGPLAICLYGLVVCSASSTASWSASVDPQLQIDPSFQYAADYTLEVSPSNPSTPTSTIPEPASLPLLSTVLLALLGAGTYKRGRHH